MLNALDHKVSLEIQRIAVESIHGASFYDFPMVFPTQAQGLHRSLFADGSGI